MRGLVWNGMVKDDALLIFHFRGFQGLGGGGGWGGNLFVTMLGVHQRTGGGLCA